MKPIHLDVPSRTYHHAHLSGYLIGLGLSALLTVASFGVVMSGLLSHRAALTAIVLLCVVQLVVQLVFFLHLGTAPDQRSNTAIFICAALLISIVVAGSLWVTHNAKMNMMPTQMSIERAAAKD